MKQSMRLALVLAGLALALTGCRYSGEDKPVVERVALQQDAAALLKGEVMAVAYSGFREGQHPDRGAGANNPTREQILEDLNILVEHDFGLIRLYDAGENSRTTLELIRSENLPIKVLQGIWLTAEFSNHEGCPWLDAPIPDDELAANTKKNAEEIAKGIALATQPEARQG